MVSLLQIKRYLDIDDADNYDDDILLELKEAVEDLVISIANRGFKKENYRQMITSADTFYLKCTPIHEVLSIKVNGREITDYIYDEEAVYYDTKGQDKTLYIDYIGGYEKIPKDIQSIIIKAVVRQYRDYKDETYNVSALKEGTVSMTYTEKDMLTDSEREIIEKYRFINI